MTRKSWCYVAVAVMLVGSPISSNGAELLSAKAAVALQQALPDFEVNIIDPLTLKIGPHGHPDLQINLDRIDHACTASPADCDRMLADFVSKIVGAVQADQTPSTKAALRAVVRPAFYVEQVANELGSNAAGGLISEPITDGLVALCYFDMPTTMRIATSRDIESLGLTSKSAMQLCKDNIHASLKPLQQQLNALPGQSLGYLSGDPYESSYVLLHDDWAPFAAHFGNVLLVSVPSADTILYADGQKPDSVLALRAVTKEYFEKAERPISPEVFRWTETGWEVMPPP